MPVQKGRFWEARAKHKLIRPYRASGVLTKNFATHDEAFDWETRTRKLLAAGILPEELREDEERITQLGQAIKLYITKTSVKPSSQQTLLVNYVRVGGTPLRDIDYKWAERWVAHMKHEHQLAPGTIRTHIGALARCLDWLMATEQSTLIRNPLRLLPRGYSSYNEADESKLEAQGLDIQEDEERDRRLEEGEEPRIRHILAGGKPEGKQRPLKLNQQRHLEAMFDVALETAMRMREMYTLTVDQVDLARATVFLTKTKNGTKRQVPLSSVALRVFGELIKGLEPSDQVFPWYGGKAEKRSEEVDQLKRITAMLSQQYARIFKAAKCEGLKFHDLRHEATSRLFERTTMSEMEIAKITGHKTQRTLARYANLRGSNLASRLW